MSSARASERIETASYPSRVISSMRGVDDPLGGEPLLGLPGARYGGRSGACTRTRTGPACQVRSRSGGFVGSGMTNSVLDTNTVRV